MITIEEDKVIFDIDTAIEFSRYMSVAVCWATVLSKNSPVLTSDERRWINTADIKLQDFQELLKEHFPVTFSTKKYLL